MGITIIAVVKLKTRIVARTITVISGRTIPGALHQPDRFAIPFFRIRCAENCAGVFTVTTGICSSGIAVDPANIVDTGVTGFTVVV